jgi:hypothetical protein
MEIIKYLITALTTILLAGCSMNSKEESLKLNDGMYHVAISCPNLKSGRDTTYYGYAIVKRGNVTGLDSDNEKPVMLGIYAPAKINVYSGLATIKTWSGMKYDIQIMTVWGDKWTMSADQPSAGDTAR